MASKQELEVQVLDLQRTNTELSEKISTLEAGGAIATPVVNDGKLEALQREVSRSADQLKTAVDGRIKAENDTLRLEALVKSLKADVAALEKRVSCSHFRRPHLRPPIPFRDRHTSAAVLPALHPCQGPVPPGKARFAKPLTRPHENVPKSTETRQTRRTMPP